MRSRACEVRRSIVSTEANGPTAAWTTGACAAAHGARAHRGGENAAEADRRDRHRRCRGSEAQPRAAAQASDHDRALELLEPSFAKRHREAGDRAAELAARRACVEVRVQQHALEARQLAVDLGRRPVAGALTFAAHGPHDSFDGGGVQKLDPQTREWRLSTSTPITTRISPRTMKTAELLIVSFCSSRRRPAQSPLAEARQGQHRPAGRLGFHPRRAAVSDEEPRDHQEAAETVEAERDRAVERRSDQRAEQRRDRSGRDRAADDQQHETAKCRDHPA